MHSEEGVVFLNNVIPGEEVSYRIRERARGVLWGELLNVVSPSQNRVRPPCPYFGECGGCVFQHIDYAYQQTIKQAILQNDLERIARLKIRLPAVIKSPPYGYRIRARMKGYDDGRIGFIRKGTNKVLPIDHCLLFPELINHFLKQWNGLPKPPFFHQLDIFFNPDSNKLYIYLSHSPEDQAKAIFKSFHNILFSWKGNEEKGVSTLRIKDSTYHVSPDVFFQVNSFQWENMLNVVEKWLKPSQAKIDLYCGAGFFIPLLQAHSQKVFGVENYGFSVQLAQRSFPGAEFLKIPAEKFHFPPAETIILDPPRSGLPKEVIKRILARKYQQIIYISCASAVFSRDLKILLENSYSLENLKIFDLFPQTPHIETIALIERFKSC